MYQFKKNEDLICIILFDDEDYTAVVYKFGAAWPCFIFPNETGRDMLAYVENKPYEGYFFFLGKKYTTLSLQTSKKISYPKWLDRWIATQKKHNIKTDPILSVGYERLKYYNSILAYKKDHQEAINKQRLNYETKRDTSL